MKTNTNIQHKIEDTLKSLDGIQQVNVSPFFKDKAMQRLFSKKEESVSLFNWFTPKLQLATLACVLLINLFAVKQINEAKDTETISKIASEFGITTNSNDSFFNL